MADMQNTTLRSEDMKLRVPRERGETEAANNNDTALLQKLRIAELEKHYQGSTNEVKRLQAEPKNYEEFVKSRIQIATDSGYFSHDELNTLQKKLSSKESHEAWVTERLSAFELAAHKNGTLVVERTNDFEKANEGTIKTAVDSGLFTDNEIEIIRNKISSPEAHKRYVMKKLENVLAFGRSTSLEELLDPASSPHKHLDILKDSYEDIKNDNLKRANDSGRFSEDELKMIEKELSSPEAYERHTMQKLYFLTCIRDAKERWENIVGEAKVDENYEGALNSVSMVRELLGTPRGKNIADEIERRRKADFKETFPSDFRLPKRPSQ